MIFGHRWVLWGPLGLLQNYKEAKNRKKKKERKKLIQFE